MSLDDIRQSANSGELIVVLGAGSSIALTSKSKSAPNWPQLIQNGLEYGQSRGLVSSEQKARYFEALNSQDIDDMLAAAEFVGRKLEAPLGNAYARWLSNVFQNLKPDTDGMENALKAIGAQRIPVATLNFDTLAEITLGKSSIDYIDKHGLMSWARRENDGILHLHGVWTNPQNCLFGIRDYQSASYDEVRAFIQRSLSALRRFLFVGCGDTFADPNFSSLIKWLRSHIGVHSLQHYALVRNDEAVRRLADPNWQGFVEPIGYGEHHSELPGFLLDCFPTQQKKRKSSSRVKNIVSPRHSKIISSYKAFILRDCGEMTIEGVRADMDTAQRKFDLEKLFVPLTVSAFPPNIPASSRDREARLQEWKEKNPSPIDFSESVR